MGDVSAMIGLQLTRIEGMSRESEEITFHTTCGRTFRMWHEQDCCESVSVDDVTGDATDLIGSPMLMAEETSNSKDTQDGSETWTFYKFATAKGYVTVRWLGSSNGYYSEGVTFEEVRSE